MSNIETQLEELFARRGADVQVPPEMPVRLPHRARIRRAGYALGMLGSALAIAVGVVGIRSLDFSMTGRGDGTIPGGKGPGPAAITLDVDGLGFSDDGARFFAISPGDLGGRIYDTATGELVKSVEWQRGDGVIAFGNDGNVFATATGDPLCCHTYLYETDTGRELFEIRDACCLAVFSADGSRVAVPSNGHTKIFRVPDGDLVKELDSSGALAFSPDGEQLAVSSSDEGIVARVFDLGSNDSPVLTLHGDVADPTLTQLAWSPDGSILIAAKNDGKAVAWDAVTGQIKLEIASPSGRITWVAFGSAPGRVATGSSDGTAIVWDISTSEPRPILTRHVEMGDADRLYVALSPDGTHLMTTGNETSIWDIS
jgi:WD40 repeat protein